MWRFTGHLFDYSTGKLFSFVIFRLILVITWGTSNKNCNFGKWSSEKFTSKMKIVHKGRSRLQVDFSWPSKLLHLRTKRLWGLLFALHFRILFSLLSVFRFLFSDILPLFVTGKNTNELKILIFWFKMYKQKYGKSQENQYSQPDFNFS